MKIINRFRSKYKFLSNFADSPFKYGGYQYQNVETAYQERKTLDPKRREIIRNAKTPFEAAKLGRSKETVIQDLWFNGLKYEIMADLVYEKFIQNPNLAKKLLDTGDTILVEGNYWHDNYFGVCTCKECHETGQSHNYLGEILMKIRELLKKKGELNENKTTD